MATIMAMATSEENLWMDVLFRVTIRDVDGDDRVWAMAFARCARQCGSVCHRSTQRVIGWKVGPMVLRGQHDTTTATTSATRIAGTQRGLATDTTTTSVPTATTDHMDK